MTSTAIVTGVPGWLGTRFVEVLARGLPGIPALAAPEPRRVRCLVQPGIDAAPLRAIHPDIEIVEGDVRDAARTGELLRGAAGATVFHLAGLIHPKRIRDLYAVNVDGTRNVLEAAVAAGARRFVAVSSNSPAGLASRSDVVFDERSPYRPYMSYGRSKMLMEQLVRAATARIETVILRPCWYYGPGQPERQTNFFRLIRSGRVPIVGDGSSRRSLTYIDAACQALLLAERAPNANGKLYWIADRRPYAMEEIVSTVERLMEREFGLAVAHRRRRLPAVASPIAEVVDAALQRVGLYQQEIHVLSEHGRTIACTPALAEAELGYLPPDSLEEGMRRSIQWCVENGRRI